MNPLSRWVYLSPSFITRSVTLLVILALFSFWQTFLYLAGFVFLSAFLFRKNNRKPQGALKEGIAYSPINGKVIGIEKGVSHPSFGIGLSRISINMGFFDGYGLYLPLTSEVSKISGNPDSQRSIGYSFRTKQDVNYGLEFKKRVVGFSPEIPLLAGDRGTCQAQIGLYPFGGYLDLYLPGDSEVFTQVGDKVIAGESLIASVMKGIE